MGNSTPAESAPAYEDVISDCPTLRRPGDTQAVRRFFPRTIQKVEGLTGTFLVHGRPAT